MKERVKKWTPGPWRVGPCGPNGCPPVGTTKGLMVSMGAHDINDARHRNQAFGNANLIASAPDLIEALEDMVSLWEVAAESVGLDPRRSPQFARAEAALSLAYGETK